MAIRCSDAQLRELRREIGKIEGKIRRNEKKPDFNPQISQGHKDSLLETIKSYFPDFVNNSEMVSDLISNLSIDEHGKALINMFTDLNLRFKTIDSNEIKQLKKHKTNKGVKFGSWDTDELFHSLATAKIYFDKETKRLIKEYVFQKGSDSYQNDNKFINKQLKLLKNDLFKQSVDYLIKKKILKKEDYYSGNVFAADLYNKDNFTFNARNYPLFQLVMDKLHESLLDSESFIEYNNRRLPNLSKSITENWEAYDMYNIGVFLTNFDSVILTKLPTVFDVNPRVLNAFEDPLQGSKYVYKPKGKVENYWKDETHMSESAEELSDRLSELFITTIPRRNKQNGFMREHLVRNDFYSVSATIDSFERQYIKEIHADEEMNIMSRDPRGMFIKHIEIARSALYKSLNKNRTGLNDEQKDMNLWEKRYAKHFTDVADVIFSLYEYTQEIKSKEETAEEFSITAILGNVLNNSFGATYGIYIAGKSVAAYKELYSHDAANIASREKVFARLSLNRNRESLYKKDTIDELKTNEDFSNYIFTRFGLYIRPVQIEDLKDNIQDYEDSYGRDTKDRESMVRAQLIAVLSIINPKEFVVKIRGKKKEEPESVFNRIEQAEDRAASGDYGENEARSSIIQDVLGKMEGILKTYLIEQKSTPLTTIEMSSGEKIPTFKLANLSYNDSEVILRQLEYEVKGPKGKNENTSYRNLYVNGNDLPTGFKDQILLGTTTKLELINKDKNKTASSWSVAENFTSSFMQDFIGISTTTEKKLKWLNVIIGNYSDKNTILAKQINRNVSVDGKKLIGGANAISITDLTKFTREQQLAFMKDTYKDIIIKYNELFDTNFSDSIVGKRQAAFDGINAILETKTKDQLLQLAQDKGVELTIEKDYTFYNIGNKKRVLSLNQNILDYLTIFSTKTNFDKFLTRDLESTSFDIINSEKGESGQYLFTDDELTSLGAFGLEGVLDFFNITKEEIEPFLVEGIRNRDVDGDTVETEIVERVLIKSKNGQINPLVARWHLLNMLFRNEYLNITVKHEYMHPAKEVQRRTFRDLGNYDNFVEEASSRYSTMAKRNVSFTSTFERAVQNFVYGVPKKVNTAIIGDPTTTTYNVNGDVESRLEFQDGSSTINYLYSRMIKASYPGKNYSSTLKRFGTFITDTGSAVKKDAEQVLTNSLMRRSVRLVRSGINYAVKQKQMLSIKNVNIQKIEISTPDLAIFEDGRYYLVQGVEIRNNQMTRLMTEVDTEGERLDNQPEQEEPKEINNLFDIWKKLGAQHSGSFVNGKYKPGEQSNDFLYSIITKQADLKDKMIHIIANSSTFKSGATNVNPSTRWNDGEKLNYIAFESAHMGPQLDAGHAADNSKIKEISQVLSGLAQSGTTSDIAHMAYQDIARIITETAKNYIETLNDMEPEAIRDLLLDTSKSLMESIAKSKGNTLASSLVTVFKNNAILPFSNQNFFDAFVQDLMTRLNTDFIARYYDGLGAVLLPSHNAVMVFEKDGIVYTQDSIFENALKDFNNDPTIYRKGLSPEEILNTFIDKTFTDDSITLDEAQLGDTIRINGEEFVLDNPSKYYEIKYKSEHHIKTPIKLVKNVPRNLKPQEISYVKMNNRVTKDSLAIDLDFTTIPEKLLEFVKFVEDTDLDKFSRRGRRIEAMRDSEGNLLIRKSLDDALKHKKILHELIGHQGIKLLFVTEEEKEYFNKLLLSLEDYLVNRPELILNSGYKTLAEFAKAYGYDVATEKGTLLLLEELVARHVELDIDFSTPLSKEAKIIGEIFAMSRKALETGESYTKQLKTSPYFQESTKKNLFDLQSVKLRYSIKKPDDMTIDEKKLTKAFADKFSLWSGNSINYKKLDKYLLQWTQRQLAFLDEGNIIEDIPRDEKGNYLLDEYFPKNETLTKSAFVDVKDSYNIKKVLDYTFKGAELILSNIYETTFNTKDSIAEIKSKGYEYFKEKLTKEFNESDETKADLKVTLSGGEVVYIKLINSIPIGETDRSIFKVNGKKKSRMGINGEILYTVPNFAKASVKDDKEIIYISAAEYIDDKSIVRDYEVVLTKLLNSFKGVRSIVPVLNDTAKDFIRQDGTKVDLEKELIQYFLKFSKVNYNVTGKAKTWYIENMDRILDNISRKQFVSWDKSRYFIAARIPAQSMQSFMPMENIAYFGEDTNDAYVSIWQIWLQGSDFDIDKVYLMGYGFNKNSQLDLWTDLFDYDSKEKIDVLELLPIPTNVPVLFGEAGLDISKYNNWYKKIQSKAGNYTTLHEVAKAMSINDIKEYLLPLLLEVKRYSNNISAEAVRENKKLANIELYGDSNLVDFIHRFNLYDGYITSGKALQNSIVSKINRVISAPSNQLLATMPVSIEQWHDGARLGKEFRLKRISETVSAWLSNTDAEKVSIKELIATLAGVNIYALSSSYSKFLQYKTKRTIKKNITQEISRLINKVERFSPTNGIGMFKQQLQATIGKKDVGIGANGLKVGFALSDYYNQWFDGLRSGIEQVNDFNEKLFYKNFYINGKEKPIVRIADVKIDQEQIEGIFGIYGLHPLIEEYNAYMALALSGFVSGATDNAKELVMAKINAVVDLASIHIYMLILGYSAGEISIYMNSDIGRYVSEGLNTNLFKGETAPRVDELVQDYKNSVSGLVDIDKLNKITDTFLDVYNGSKELSSIASIFKVNTSLKANSDQLHNFLGTIESAMYNAEVRTLKFDLGKLKTPIAKWKEKALIDVVNSIVENNSTIGRMFTKNQDATFKYIYETIESVQEIPIFYINYDGKERTRVVNVAGGEFDARYYVHPKNTAYREAAIKYYNLVKNTINSFDVLENVPHFREMAHGVGITFQISLLASKKFNWVFSKIRDLIRHESMVKKRDISVGKSRNAEKIKNAFGNNALRFSLDDKFIRRAYKTFDSYMISSWLRSKKKEVTNFRFSVRELLKESGVESITLFTSDRAKIYKDNELRSAKTINVESSEYTTIITAVGESDMIIDLTTDFGIANFKILTEQVLLPILQKSQTNGLGNLLTLRSLRNYLGGYSTQIVPIFGLSSMNNAVAIENFSKIINEFNVVDRDLEYRVKNASSKPLSWKDILYVYNLVVNNEAYGDLRITPLFQDYAKETNSIAASYLKYGREIDSGIVDIFDVETTGDKAAILKKQQVNNILFSVFNNHGYLRIDGRESMVWNNNFLINTTLQSADYKDGLNFQLVKSIVTTIGSQNLLINYICN